MALYRQQIKLIGLGVIALPLAFIALLLLINLSVFDQELEPEVARLIAPSPTPPQEDNAYFAVFGFQASAEKDMQQAGIALASRYRSNRDNQGRDELSDADFEEILGAKDLDKSWLEVYSNCRTRNTLGCLAQLRGELDRTPLTDPRLTLLLSRYQRIIGMSHYRHIEDVSFATPLPAYGVLMRIGQLHLADLSRGDDSLAFLAALQRDSAFWRMMLEQGNSLIEKMIAVAALWTDAQFLSEYLAEYPANHYGGQPFDGRTLELAGQIVRPLSQTELDIGEAFRMELLAFYGTLEYSDAQTKALFELPPPLFWLLQTNATVNTLYRITTKPLMQLSALDSAELARHYATETTAKKNTESLINFSPSSLYNLGGKILFSGEASAPWPDYPARVHDLNAMLILVRLQLAAVANPQDPITEISARAEFANPYSGAPMDYNSEQGWLEFECLSLGSLCRIRL